MSYPLNHLLGYSVLPRDLVNLEPFIRDGAAVQVYAVLVSRVSHKARWAGGSRGDVFLQPGECLVGVREIAEKLGRGKNTVDRALKKLETLGLITRKAGHRGTVVTICRYGDFDGHAGAPRDTAGDTAGDAAGDTAGVLTNGKRETGNGKQDEREDARAGKREIPHLPSEAELRREAVTRAEEAYRYLLKHVGELQMDQVPGMPRLWPTPGAQLEDAGIVAAAAKYSAEQLRHVIDYRVAEARQKRDGERLNPSSLFHPKAIAFALNAAPAAKVNGTATTTGGARVVRASEVRI